MVIDQPIITTQRITNHSGQIQLERTLQTKINTGNLEERSHCLWPFGHNGLKHLSSIIKKINNNNYYILPFL